MTKREALEALEKASGRIETLQLQVEQLQGQLPPCDGGCNVNDGPEETCSQHGRPVADVWEIAQRFAEERNRALDLRAEAWWEGAQAQWKHRPIGNRIPETENPHSASFHVPNLALEARDG